MNYEYQLLLEIISFSRVLRGLVELGAKGKGDNVYKFNCIFVD